MRNTTIPFFFVIILLISLLVWSCSPSKPQDSSQNEVKHYPISDSIGISSNFDMNISPLDKKHWGMDVYKKLLNAIGIPFETAPILLQGIYTQPIFFDTIGGPSITICVDIYKLCEQLGTNEKEVALCFLLGHELVHYREDEGNFKNCLEATANNEIEDRADMLGAFWTFYTGYKKVFDAKIISTFLDSLYNQSQYSIDSLGIHSPVEIRKKAASRAIEKSKYLADVFKIGIYFLVIQEYAHAEICFRFLDEFLNLKEVKNNLGLAQFMLAESVVEKDKRVFYPLDLAANPIYDDRSSIIDRDSLLVAAIAHLKQAVQLYPENDFSSSLNLACAISSFKSSS